ncbi:MAG: hypothetical protein K2O18_01950 [Oscillospiraceae bacterium]|nr:hypothetical protein [Oscillospiraceae bacterium]
MEKMRQYLLAQGVPNEKIIDPVMFLHRNSEKCQLDLIADIQERYVEEEGLIFGLSYSLRDIRIEQLNRRFFDCSWSSLDLYYNFQIYRHMAGEGLLSAVKTAFLVFPYYYFDYDMSRFLYLYRTGYIFSVWRLNDWHHSDQVPGAASYITNYKMFGEKLSRFYHFKKFGYQSRAVYQGNDGEAVLNKIWFRNYDETAAENRALFTQFLHSLAENHITPVLIIPPFYLRGIDQPSRAAFFQKKEKFYTILQGVRADTGYAFKIFDYAGFFADRPEVFMDLTHLNTRGAEEFTEIINSDIL